MRQVVVCIKAALLKVRAGMHSLASHEQVLLEVSKTLVLSTIH